MDADTDYEQPLDDEFAEVEIPDVEEPVQSIAKNTSALSVIPAKWAAKYPKLVQFGNQILNPRRIPTGMFEFDLATNGGFPCGKYSVIYGPEGSGKSNVCYQAAAQAQKLPPPCNVAVWVDMEGTYDPVWAAAQGVDVERLIVVKPDYGEQCVDLVDALVREDVVAFLCVDSIAAIIGISEIDKSTEKADVGSQALLCKRLCNKLVNAFTQQAKKNHYPCVVLVNQTRMKIGVMFGDPETTPCGQTVRFLSSLTVRIYGKDKMVKEISSELPVFKEVKLVIKKAKVPINMKEVEYDHCVLAHDQLRVGQTPSFNIVQNHLKANNLLMNLGTGKGWQIGGKEIKKTLKDFADWYYSDSEFALRLQKMVISKVGKNAFEVKADDETA